jgi:hypothetical protein
MIAAASLQRNAVSQSVDAGLRISRLGSESNEASNNKAPLLKMPGLSKTVDCNIKKSTA